jgi:hypothetical protein
MFEITEYRLRNEIISRANQVTNYRHIPMVVFNILDQSSNNILSNWRISPSQGSSVSFRCLVVARVCRLGRGGWYVEFFLDRAEQDFVDEVFWFMWLDWTEKAAKSTTLLAGIGSSGVRVRSTSIRPCVAVVPSDSPFISMGEHIVDDVDCDGAGIGRSWLLVPGDFDTDNISGSSILRASFLWNVVIAASAGIYRQ